MMVTPIGCHVQLTRKMNNMDNRLSFFSGFTLTSIWTMPLYEMSMAFLLGLVGGLGGSWIVTGKPTKER